MAQIPADAARSEEGQWWWDGSQWQPVGEQAAGSDATSGDTAADTVPATLVAAGAPASLDQWTDEQREAFFEGQVSEAGDAGSPEQVQVLAIRETGDGDEATA
jgi:hypothetical protein